MTFGFVACQQEDDFAPQQSGDEITITAQVGKAQTRAAVNELTHVQTYGFGFFCVGGTNYDKSNLKVTYSESESAWTTTEKILSPGKTTTMNVFAYYPYDEHRTSASEDYVVTLPTDQSAGLLAADHLTAAGSLVLNDTHKNGDIKYDNGKLSIAFRHAFSKVHFNVNLRDQFTNDNITKVEVEAPVTAVLNGATVTVPANAETGKVQICKEETATDGYTSSYEGIILPGNYTYKVHFTMSNGTVQTYAATTAREFEQNKVYTQSITIGKNGVKVELTSVEPWGAPEYENTGTVEEIYMTSTVKGTTAAIDLCSRNAAGITADIQKLLKTGVTTLTVNGTLNNVQQNAVAAALTNFSGTLIMDMGENDVTDGIKNLICSEKHFGGYTYEDNTYTVYTAAGLQTWGDAARSNLTTGLTLKADIILPSTMTIDNDGDGINESNWKCLVPDMSSTKYSGTIEGNDHTIYGLTMTGHSGDNLSFIGYMCDRSNIRNLNFADIHLTGGENSAAIVNLFYDGTIENCHVLSGTIDGNTYVAGIVGRAESGSSVVNCSNAATVSSKTYAGGITTKSFANITTRHTNVIACRNSGEVKGDYTGGIVAIADKNSTIAGCYNTVAVFGTERAGGISAQANNNPTVTACYNTGAVTGEACGGIVGFTTKVSEGVTGNYTGGSSPSGGDYATAVDDTDVTWKTAMTAMNTTLTKENPDWKYVQNTGSDASTCPLVIQAKAE